MKEVFLPMGKESLIAPEQLRSTYLGTLGELGLGNPNGIPSSLKSEKEIKEYIDLTTQSFVPIADSRHLGCIDGRSVLEQADGSSYTPRGRQAGGLLTAYITAELGGSMLLQTSQTTDPVARQELVFQALATDQRGYEASSHSEGCGAALRVADHLRSITKPAVATAVEALLAHPAIQKTLEVEFEASLMNDVAANANQLADNCDTAWSGMKFCEQTKVEAPEGFELLEGNDQQPFHGHREPAIILVASQSDITPSKAWFDARGIDNPFVITLRDTRRIASLLPKLRTNDNQPTLSQAVIANLAFHLGVGDNLPHPDMPVVVLHA